MCIFFLNRYIKDTFKLNEVKLNIITLIVGIIVAYGSGKLFPNSEVGVEFIESLSSIYIRKLIWIINYHFNIYLF